MWTGELIALSLIMDKLFPDSRSMPSLSTVGYKDLGRFECFFNYANMQTENEHIEYNDNQSSVASRLVC